MVTADINPDTGTGMIVLRPNNSSTWRFNMLVVASLAFVAFCISMFFLLQGLWMVLPFSGLEILFLIWALSCCVNNNITTEVITFDNDTVMVERGRRFAENRWEYNRAWSKIFVKQPDYRGHMKKIFIRSHGKELELGSFLNREDRELLIKQLKVLVYA